MRFVTFDVDGQTSWGIADDQGIIDIGGRKGGSLLQALQQDSLGTLRDEFAGTGADHSPETISWLPPVDRPEKIICIGVNYANRNDEYRDGSSDPDWPSVFMRTRDSFTGHRQPLWRPPESDKLDYEGEIALIIGREAHRVSRENAPAHIAGLTLANEGTLRDWVRHAKFNVTQGKNFVHSGALGPWMVTADEFENYDNLHISTQVNGELRQDDSTANLMFPFDFLISYLSTCFILRPGDVILTGTPLGAGARFDPPRYLAPGDEVIIESPAIGTLRNGVMDDPTVDPAHSR